MSIQLAAIIFAGTTAFAAMVLIYAYKGLLVQGPGANDADMLLSPMRKFIDPRKLLSVRFALGIFLAVLGVAVLILGNVLSPLVYVPVGAGLGFVGWKLPYLWFMTKVKKRKQMFDSQILHLTMTLANGLRSGQALPQALEAASQRMGEPMSEELALVLNEARYGLDLTEALERLHTRMPGEDLRLLITSIRLTLQSGGSLADVLERMVVMIRARTEFHEKLKTMTAQGRFEAIAMSLAPVFVYFILRLIDPELMKPLTGTLIGWCTIGGVAIMISVGFFIINKIVTIEV